MLGISSCTNDRLVPWGEIKIAKSLRADCADPNPRTVKGANELALQTLKTMLCERAKKQAILGVVDSLNSLVKEKK